MRSLQQWAKYHSLCVVEKAPNNPLRFEKEWYEKIKLELQENDVKVEFKYNVGEKITDVDCCLNWLTQRYNISSSTKFILRRWKSSSVGSLLLISYRPSLKNRLMMSTVQQLE